MRSLTRILALLACLMVSLPAAGRADPPSPAEALSERVRSLEAEIARLRQEVASLREETAGLRAAGLADAQQQERLALQERRIAELEASLVRLGAEVARLGDGLRAAQDQLDTVSVEEGKGIHLGVYGNFIAEDFEGSRSVLDAEAFETVLSARPSKRLGFFAEIELERAASVGGERGGEVVLEQAYSNFTLSPLVNLRAGAILVPFGNVNVEHYAPTRDIISKPIVSYVVAPSDWTDNGLGLYGRGRLGGEWVFNYEAYAVAGLDADITALGTRASRQPFGADNNNNKAVAARAAIMHASTLELGLSGYTGKYDDAGKNRLNGWAFDGLVRLGPVKLSGEYNHFLARRLAGRDGVLEGWFGRLTWDLPAGIFGHAAVHRALPDAVLSLVYQYDWTQLEGPLGVGWARNRETRSTVGLNFRPAHQWVLKINHEENKASWWPLVRGNRDGWLVAVGFLF